MIPEHGWKCLWSVLINRKKKPWSVSLLLCLIVSFEHTNLFHYCLPLFPYHDNLSGSYCIAPSYLSYFSTSPSLSSSRINFPVCFICLFYELLVLTSFISMSLIFIEKSVKLIEWKKHRKISGLLFFSISEQNDDTF